MTTKADSEALNTADIASPDWHGDVLAERERLTSSGEEEFVAWDTAKKELREELT